jgi:hypothetical protein
MSLSAVMPLEQVDIGGVSLRPEDLLSDDTIGLMNNLHHNISTITEDDPLYKEHLAFKAEIENRPIMIVLDDIKFEDIDDDSGITNISLYDTDRVEFENIDGINESWFIGAKTLHQMNYAVPDAIAEALGNTYETVKVKNHRGKLEEQVRLNHTYIPDEIEAVFHGKIWETV